MKRIAIILVGLLLGQLLFAQEKAGNRPLKIKHAEPLYLDLMRDLGARKGEAEFNVGYGIAQYSDRKAHTGFVEYEWAVADRLGLEIEVPFSFSTNKGSNYHQDVEGLKLGTQYTFLVSEKHQASFAIGYMHELEIGQNTDPQVSAGFFKESISSPFLVAAKNFTALSTLIYVGPQFAYSMHDKNTHTSWSLNGSVHYMVPNSMHFIGLENNINIINGKMDYVLRPQIKVGIKPNFAIGILSGIPIKSERFQMDFMTRVIWEPNFKK